MFRFYKNFTQMQCLLKIKVEWLCCKVLPFYEVYSFIKYHFWGKTGSKNTTRKNFLMRKFFSPTYCIQSTGQKLQLVLQRGKKKIKLSIS